LLQLLDILLLEFDLGDMRHLQLVKLPPPLDKRGPLLHHQRHIGVDPALDNLDHRGQL
jgi:hypothetical protein